MCACVRVRVRVRVRVDLAVSPVQALDPFHLIAIVTCTVMNMKCAASILT